jgi:hypothetical protein
LSRDARPADHSPATTAEHDPPATTAAHDHNDDAETRSRAGHPAHHHNDAAASHDRATAASAGPAEAGQRTSGAAEGSVAGATLPRRTEYRTPLGADHCGDRLRWRRGRRAACFSSRARAEITGSPVQSSGIQLGTTGIMNSCSTVADIGIDE